MTRTLRLLVALAVAGALAFTGCGGDDDDGDEAGGEDAGSLADMDEACLDAVRAYGRVFSSIGADLEDAQDDLDAFEAYADGAPEEIREDMQVIAGAFRRYVEVIAETGFDPTSSEVPDDDTRALLDEAAEDLDRDEVTQASDRVSEHFEDSCDG
jgi:hypothetical protein